MKAINRRSFLKLAGLSVAAVALPALAGNTSEITAPKPETKFRVRLLSPETATRAEQAFCQRARFKTAADAMRACAARRLEAEIYKE